MKTQITLPDLGPCQCSLCAGVPLPHPTTGSVVLTVKRGRVLRVEDLGPATEAP